MWYKEEKNKSSFLVSVCVCVREREREREREMVNGKSSHWLPSSMRKWLDDSARNAWKKGLSQALNSDAHIGTGVHGRGEEIASDAIKVRKPVAFMCVYEYLRAMCIQVQ